MTPEGFAPFYRALTGRSPFQWQQRLVDDIVAHGSWPEDVHAPTGAGKSAVIEMHAFVNALNGWGAGPRVPRRLAICVNRRAIVDQHFDAAVRLAGALVEHLDKEGPIGEVARGLQRLRARHVVSGEAGPPLWVANLRGGVSPTREWLDDITACGVVAVTPDMWGSRALFSGYGVRSLALGREAGALVMDTVLVLDEAHLSRQLHHTAKTIQALAAPTAERVGVPGLQVVATTATPSVGATRSVGVEEGDLADDDELSRRLTAKKPVEYIEVPPPPAGKASAAHINALVRNACELEQSLSSSDAPSTVGVFVNRVDTAVRVAAGLRSEVGEAAVKTWVGRMRPLDLERERRNHPGLFTVDGDPSVTFLVATQTVEVGVDLDLAGLVTELAPPADLVQRSGRINRLGRREESPIRVLGPGEDQLKDYAPYTETDLRAGFVLTNRLAESADGFAPVRLAAESIPPSSMERVLTTLKEPEVRDLACTSDAVAEPDELSFWLRDSLEEEVEPVSFVMRVNLPEDDAIAASLLTKTAPVATEMFPVRLSDARRIVSEILEDEWRPRLFLWEEQKAVMGGIEQLRPGAIVMMDARVMTVSKVLGPEPPYDSSVPVCLWSAGADEEPDGLPRVLLVRGTHDALLDEIQAADVDELADWTQARFGPTEQSQVGPLNEDGDVAWFVALPAKDLVADEVVRQEWSSSGRRVSLEQHATNVAEQAAEMARAVGFQPRMVRALHDAGLWHDEGKRDARFQREVLGGDGKDMLAKSGVSPQQWAVRRKASSSLPTGWRHEQLSVAMVVADGHVEDLPLVARLVGTSHGHGRLFFPSGSADLLPGHGKDSTVSSEAVRRASDSLFTTHAGWSDILEETDREFGPWGTAYLEAVLRCADGMVSKEGS